MRALLKHSRLEYCALLLALLLSIVCMVRGLVDDGFVIIALIGAIPLMWLSLSSHYEIHPVFSRVGIALLSLLFIILALQWVAIDSLDVSEWVASLGRLLFFAMIGIIALQIGASGAAARVFLLSLLFFSIIMVGISFSLYKSDTSGLTDYSHGFVNPNNAATYLGIMLIVNIVHINSYLRHRVKWEGGNILERIENMKIETLMKILFMLFGCMLFLAGLFLTNSRGGVILSLAVCTPLILILSLKRKKEAGRIKRLFSVILIASMAILMAFWVFNQHGAGLVKDIVTQGFDSDRRPDLFGAVIPMITDHPLLGHGLGGFDSQFQSYRSETMPVEGLYDKAHNSYLELAAEMGLPLLILIVLVAALMAKQFLFSIAKRKRHYGKPTTGLAVITLVGLHSLIDFPLQIPAILALVIAVLIICVVQSDRNYVLSKPRRKSKSKAAT